MRSSQNKSKGSGNSTVNQPYPRPKFERCSGPSRLSPSLRPVHHPHLQALQSTAFHAVKSVFAISL